VPSSSRIRFYRQSGFALADGDRLFEKASDRIEVRRRYGPFVENEFGVLVSDCEMSEDNLGSLRAVARFVASKQPFAVG